MPHLRTTWYLAGVHPDVVMTLLLMLMYDRFLGRIGGRSFRPMILGSSPIVPHFFALLGDICGFPFFARSERLRMLAYAGTSMHIVRAICGPTTNYRVMQMILRRILSRTLGNPAIASRLSTSLLQMMASPLMPQISIDVRQGHNQMQKTIWENLAQIISLPDSEGILDLLCQQTRYQKLCILIIFRRLFAMKNRLFVLLCDCFHKISMLGFLENPRIDIFKIFCREYKSLSKTLDFIVFEHYMGYLLKMCLTKKKQKMPVFDQYLFLINIFLRFMNITQDWNSVSILLSEKDPEVVLQLLNTPPQMDQMQPNFQFSLKYPTIKEQGISSCQIDLFNTLKRAYLIILPLKNDRGKLFSSFERWINRAECSDPLKVKNRLARLLFILFKFINFVQSNHEHLPFICEWFFFMKKNQSQMSECSIFELFLYLQQGCVFHDLLSHFCEFSIPSNGYSEMTKQTQTFLLFFDMMIRVLSNELFVNRLQILLERNRVRFDVEDLIQGFRFHPILDLLNQIKPFRETHCRSCNERLHSNIDDGLCHDCTAEIYWTRCADKWEKNQLKCLGWT